MQKFGEHEQASTRLNFASSKNFNAPSSPLKEKQIMFVGML